MPYMRIKLECHRCGLHLAIYTWYPDRHSVKTIACPECGCKHGGFALYMESNKGEIFEEILGASPLWEYGEPVNSTLAKDGLRYWNSVRIHRTWKDDGA